MDLNRILVPPKPREAGRQSVPGFDFFRMILAPQVFSQSESFLVKIFGLLEIL